MTKKGFVPCGAGVVILKGQKVLLVREKTSDRLTKKRAGQWGIPGGRLEDSREDLITLSKREVEEETGYKIKPISLLGVYQAEVVGLVFRAGIIGRKQGSFDHEEIAEIRFFSKEEIQKMKEEEFRPGHKFFLLTDAFNEKRRFPFSFYRFLYP